MTIVVDLMKALDNCLGMHGCVNHSIFWRAFSTTVIMLRAELPR